MTIEVLLTTSYPGSALSNLAAHDFVFDGVACASMEGLLQAFKFLDHSKQVEICALAGLEAKFAGRAGNGWKAYQTLWWKGEAYDRHGLAYADLLYRAFDALLRNEDFRAALLATGDQPLTHEIGSSEPSRTVLTPAEFIVRLLYARSVVRLTARLLSLKGVNHG